MEANFMEIQSVIGSGIDAKNHSVSGSVINVAYIFMHRAYA